MAHLERRVRPDVVLMRLTQECVDADTRRPVVSDQPLRVAADCRVRALGAEGRENEGNNLVAIVVGLDERSKSEVVHPSDQSVLTAIRAMRTRIVSLEYLKASEEAVVRIEKSDEVRTVDANDVLHDIVVSRPVERIGVVEQRVVRP